MLIVQASRAAFSASTQNSSNAWSTGQIALTDDDSGTAGFSATNLTGGASTQRCIEISYSGTVDAPVRLYSGSVTGALASYLDTTIEVGSGGAFPDCTGFVPSSTVFSGTLAAFGATHTNWSDGLATHTATTPTSSVVFRITVQVQNSAAAMNKTAGADFTWEAQA